MKNKTVVKEKSYGQKRRNEEYDRKNSIKLRIKTRG